VRRLTAALTLLGLLLAMPVAAGTCPMVRCRDAAPPCADCPPEELEATTAVSPPDCCASHLRSERKAHDAQAVQSEVIRVGPIALLIALPVAAPAAGVCAQAVRFSHRGGTGPPPERNLPLLR
jgi:hypothetical protein